MKTLAVMGAALMVSTALPASAKVVDLQITSRTPMKGSFGKAGDYELLIGRYFGELDPQAPGNLIITDLDHASRNARGKVEYSATFALAKPVDMTKASGVLFYDVPNRGHGQAVGDEDGHVHVVSGWQGDIPPTEGLQTITVPVARERDGSAITGSVLMRIIDPPSGAKSITLSSGLGNTASNSTPANLDSAKARLVRRRSDSEPGELVPASQWSFGDCGQAPFPGVPDAHHLCLKNGFDPAFAYELTYTAKNPLVLGIGFAAVRDLNAFLRYSAGSAKAPNPVAKTIRWTVMTGVSQSGNFVRSFIHLGFNQAEDGRIVFDGANPQIAGRQALLNIRFGVPGGAAGLYEPGSDGVLWWGPHKDRASRLGEGSLLARCQKSGTCPKIVETFGASEFWGLRMSPDLVGREAQADISLPPNVRRYYFPGVTHGGGEGGFDLAGLRPFPGCTLTANPNPSHDSVRALLKALVDWVKDGKTPPPSRFPTLANGDLVPPNARALGFPAIPGAPKPDGKLNALIVYGFGARFKARDESGVMDKVPPAVIATVPSLVPRVDADGNETSGIPSVQARVPLGTYLGWNVKAAGYYAGQGCDFAGGFIPFAKTRAEREAKGDPRLSLEERYGSHAAFVAKVRQAAADMVREGYLLADDAERIVREAEASSVLISAKAVGGATADR